MTKRDLTKVAEAVLAGALILTFGGLAIAVRNIDRSFRRNHH